MTDTSETDDETADASRTDPVEAMVIVTDGGQSDAKIIGHNTDDSGQTVGVWGEVDSADGCGLATPDDARIEGIIDTNETDYVVEAGTQSTKDAQNVVLGHASNRVTNSVVGATIVGGGQDDGSTDASNQVYDNYGTISGGHNNQAGTPDDEEPTAEYATVGGGDGNIAGGADSTVGGGDRNTATDLWATVSGGRGNTASDSSATVAGGIFNTASGYQSTIGGGRNNTASAEGATVAGGEENTASALQSTIGGGRNNTANSGNSTVGGGHNNIASGFDSTVPGGSHGAAESDHSFVWNDDSGYHDFPGDIRSVGLSSDSAVNGEPVTGSKTFSVSAQGGVRFITGASSVTYIDGGSTGWSSSSSRAAKTNIDPVDSETILDGVTELEVATWEYKADDEDGGTGTTHIGPMAEGFHDIIDVGSSNEHINQINADGVLFAAVQGLSEKLDEQQTELDEKTGRIDNLEAENKRKEDRINNLEADRDDLKAENEQLRDRLAAVEAHIGLDAAADSAPADD